MLTDAEVAEIEMMVKTQGRAVPAIIVRGLIARMRKAEASGPQPLPEVWREQLKRLCPLRTLLSDYRYLSGHSFEEAQERRDMNLKPQHRGSRVQAFT